MALGGARSAVGRFARAGSLAVACGLFAGAAAGCGYTTRPGLASNLKTVYVAPFKNRIDLTELPNDERFPLYRHGMETEVTSAVINRFQFTGLLRPSRPDSADTRLEGELMQFRRDPLRYSASQQVEEWRLNIVVNLKFYDQRTNTLLWEELPMVGDTTYFAIGATAESESQALARAVEDLARRIVERAVENW
jgi:hypothetical protein